MSECRHSFIRSVLLCLLAWLILLMPLFAFPEESYGAASSFKLKNHTIPVAVVKGDSFPVEGTLRSANPLSKVEVGVVSKKTGKYVKGMHFVKKNVKSKLFDLEEADESLRFGSLPAGDYYYRIWAHDDTGAKKRVLNRAFTVAKKSSFKISGQTSPGELKKGSSFALKGTIRSAFPLRRVVIGVVDKKTGKYVKGLYYNKKGLKSKKFDIAKADDSIRFGTLPAGKYYYRITAYDAAGKSKRLLNKAFTVSKNGKSTTDTKSTEPASSFSISGQNYPSSILQGNAFSIYGSIRSTYPLKRVEIGVVDKSTGKWVKTCYYNKTGLSAKTFKIANADESVRFGTLPAGNYYYRIWAHDSKGKCQRILNKAFVVTSSPAAAENGLQLKYPANVLSAIGAQPYSGPCGIYAMAYARMVLDQGFSLSGFTSYQARIISQYGLGGSYAYWDRAGGTMTCFSTARSMYKAAYRQLCAGKPCIMNCYNPYSGNNHFVCVIGFVKGTTVDNVSLEHFIVLDPSTGTRVIMGNTGYQSPERSYYGPELITF